MQHTLSESDQEIARDIARQRHDSNRQEGVKDKQVGDQDKGDIDLNGFGGELAFCRVMGLKPDLAIVPGGGGDAADAILGDGRRIDVKTTKYPNGNLLAREIHDDVDLFVLVRGEFPSYELVGYTDRATLAAQPKRDIGHGLTHFLHAGELRPIEELQGEIEG